MSEQKKGKGDKAYALHNLLYKNFIYTLYIYNYIIHNYTLKISEA